MNFGADTRIPPKLNGPTLRHDVVRLGVDRSLNKIVQMDEEL